MNVAVFKLHCPKCGSSRVRRGYTKAPLWLRMFCVHDLLCDSCNLLYRGLATPGALRKARRRRRHRSSSSSSGVGSDSE